MTVRSHRIIGVLAVSLAAAFSGCNRPLNQPGTTVSPEVQKTVSEIFPHSTEFRTTRYHGSAYKKSPETCKTCHGNDLSGGSSNVSCTQCHSAYPHDAAIKTTPNHGMTNLDLVPSCMGCHTQSVAHAATPACASCHQYPHAAQWSLPKNHGTEFIKAKKDTSRPKDAVTCSTCHGENSDFKKNNPDRFVSCATCHLQMPHPDDMTDDQVHPKMVKADPASCVRCHTDYTRLLDDYGGCIGCHGRELKISVKTEFVETSETTGMRVNPHTKKRGVASKPDKKTETPSPQKK